MRLRAKRFPGLHAAGLHATPRVHLRHLSPPVGYALSSKAFSGIGCGGIACGGMACGGVACGVKTCWDCMLCEGMRGAEHMFYCRRKSKSKGCVWRNRSNSSGSAERNLSNSIGNVWRYLSNSIGSVRRYLSNSRGCAPRRG